VSEVKATSTNSGDFRSVRIPKRRSDRKVVIDLYIVEPGKNCRMNSRRVATAVINFAFERVSRQVFLDLNLLVTFSAVYTDLTWAEGTATQGCDRSADPAAGMRGGASRPKASHILARKRQIPGARGQSPRIQ